MATTVLLQRSSSMKKLITIILITATTLGLTACHKSPEQKSEYIVKRITKKLDLNSTQVEKLNAVASKVVKLHRENKTKKDEFRSDIKSLLVQDQIKQEEVLNLMERKRTQVELILPDVLPEILEFHSSLNLEQKQKLVSLMDRFTKKHRKFNH
jgi:hypothetical protein